MLKALLWWDFELTDAERDMFPRPKSNFDILAFYENPAEYCVPSNLYGKDMLFI